jgi:uncharacterized protein
VKRALLLLLLAFALLAGVTPGADAQIALPQLEARVTDLTGTLTAAQQSSLEEKLKVFEDRKGAQIAVLILPTTEPEDIAQFGVRLMETWKLGRKGVDDGAVLIVAKEDREVRIEVQYGLEGVLTDATASRIINETIVPMFKQGDFYGGINAGLDQMLRVVEGEPLPEPDQAWKAPSGKLPWPLILFGVVFLSGRLGSAIGRMRGAAVAGVVGGIAGWWLSSLWTVALGAFIAIFLLALLFGGAGGAKTRGGRVFRDSGKRGGWGGGGWGGGSSGGGWSGGGWGGGSSGGGWSGGGGRGGGGGASGRW